MQVRLVLFLSALLAVFSLSAAAASASSLGDPAISSDHPFRLNPYTLEPGCFIPGRGPVDLDSHLDLTTLDAGQIARELHVTVDHNSPVNVDQVLVPSAIDGYRIYNTFENTGRADDIGPNFTAVDLFAPDSNGYDGPDPLDKYDVIVCVSDHGAAQNEPYDQAASGSPVWAKNRPVLEPVVSALGVSAVEPLNTYKVGFGYKVDQWYTAPTFDGHSAFAAVTDPNAFGGAIPSFVRLDPREDPGVFDSRRVNDVDTANESWSGLQADYDQTRVFKQSGDNTAWLLSNNNDPDTLSHLITFTAQGDLPLSWTLRPSLASPASSKTAAIDYAFLAKWNKEWQDYYDCKADLPAMPLAPGTNSPAPDDAIDCGAQQSAPTATSAPASTSTSTTNNTTTTIVQQVAGGKSAARSANGAAAKAAKSSIRSARVIRTKTGKRLVVFVKSTKATARIQIRMYGANGRKVATVNKTVATNRSVKVNTRLAGKVKTVKVVLLG
jgi:hypothetical protein